MLGPGSRQGRRAIYWSGYQVADCISPHRSHIDYKEESAIVRCSSLSSAGKALAFSWPEKYLCPSWYWSLNRTKPPYFNYCAHWSHPKPFLLVLFLHWSSLTFAEESGTWGENLRISGSGTWRSWKITGFLGKWEYFKPDSKKKKKSKKPP